MFSVIFLCFFFFQAEDGIRDDLVTGVQTCALPICSAVDSFFGSRDLRWRGACRKCPRRCPARGRRRSCSPSLRGASTRWRRSPPARSEERRVGKEGRSRGLPYHLKKKKDRSDIQAR